MFSHQVFEYLLKNNVRSTGQDDKGRCVPEKLNKTVLKLS